MGSYLRTNYRIGGRELDITALGAAVMDGSWGYAASGPGTRREHGGLIMGSTGAAASVNPTISAFGAMSQYYGSGLFDAGYKIFPILARQLGTATQGLIEWSISATANNSLIYFITYRVSDVSTLTGASGSSLDMFWVGLIVSGP